MSFNLEAGNQFMASEACTTAEGLMRTLKNKHGFLMQLDKSMDLEVSWIMGLCGQAGEDLLFKKVLQIMPNPDGSVPITFDRAISQIKGLLNSKLARLCQKSTHGLLQAVIDQLGRMKLGQAPTIEKKATGFLLQVMNRLPFFLSVEVKQQGKEPTRVYGKEAMDIMYQELKNKYPEDQAPSSLKEVELFQIFRFLASSEIQMQASKWIQEIIKQNGLALQSMAEDKDSSAATKKKYEKKRKASQDLDKEVDDFFA